MATGFNVRVGDADRDAVAAQLRDHYADGRLTLDELNERLDLVFAARTNADLTAALRDLPHVPRPTAGAPAGGFGAASGPGPSWPGPAGPAGPAGSSGSGWNYGSTGGDQRSWGGRSRLGALIMGLVWLCVIIASLFLFGLGGGDKPLAVVLLIAAIAFLRRLFGGVRRRGPGGPRGPRGPRRRF